MTQTASSTALPDLPDASPGASEPAVSGHVDAHTVATVLSAVGESVGWCGASFWQLAASGAGFALAGTWRREDACCELSVTPCWLAGLPATTWDARRVHSQPGTVTDGTCSHTALVVPVRDETGLVGLLSYFRDRSGEPDASQTMLLEAAAGLLSHCRVDVPRVEVDPAPLSGALEQALTLVDVFAFTVEVFADGEFAWLYFGPNSDAVFGEAVSTESPLMSLLRRHVLREDRFAVLEFEQAVLAGRPAEIEVRVLGRDKVTRWVSWRGVPRRSGGHLYVDGVATDVSVRHSLGRTRQDLRQAQVQYFRQADMVRENALVVRDANDNVLQRIFAAGLRLQMLQQRLGDVDAHAAAAIAFQLDQAATDTREIIQGLNEVLKQGLASRPEQPGSTLPDELGVKRS